jgi:hypothetical protein
MEYEENRDYEARFLATERENLDLIMLIEVENLIESNPINRKRQGLWFFSLHSLHCLLPSYFGPSNRGHVRVGSVDLVAFV